MTLIQVLLCLQYAFLPLTHRPRPLKDQCIRFRGILGPTSLCKSEGPQSVEEDLIFTFSISRFFCHCVVLSSYGCRLWVISFLVIWPLRSYSTMPLIIWLSLQLPLLLSCWRFARRSASPSPSPFAASSQLVPACHQPPPPVPGLHGGFFCSCCAKCALTSENSLSRVQSTKFFCRVTFASSVVINTFSVHWCLLVVILWFWFEYEFYIGIRSFLYIQQIRLKKKKHVKSYLGLLFSMAPPHDRRHAAKCM